MGVSSINLNGTCKLERLYGFVEVERIPLEYRSRRCNVLVSGLGYGEVAGFTHLIYLLRMGYERLGIIGGVRNRFDTNIDYSSYVYLSRDFFFPNISAHNIVLDCGVHVATVYMCEVYRKKRYSHRMLNGRSLLGTCIKYHRSDYEAMVSMKMEKKSRKSKKGTDIVSVSVSADEVKRGFSVSPALISVGGRSVVGLEE